MTHSTLGRLAFGVLFFLGLALPSSAALTATTSGNTLRLTATGKTKMNTAAGVVGKAYQYALSVTGNGWTALPDISFTMEYTNDLSRPSNKDAVTMEIGAANIVTNPREGTSPVGVDDFGNDDGRAPSPDWYSRYSVRQNTVSPSDCTANNAVTQAGTCAGGVVSCKTSNIAQTPTGPWYHPNCSCVGSYMPGPPYTSPDPGCVPYGAGVDIHAVRTDCICLSGDEGIAYDGPVFNVENQPAAIAPTSNSNAEMIRAAIANGLSFIEENYHSDVYGNVNTPIGKSYGAISDGSIQLQTPVILTAPDYTIPPGSPALENDPALTSTATVEGVWVRGGLLHVIVDNADDIGGGGSSGPVEIANGTLGSVSPGAAFEGTKTLAGEWADFLAEHPEPPPIFALAANFTFPEIVVDPGWSPNVCLPFEKWGTHCLDFEALGFWTWIGLFKFFVIGGAFVGAYYIIAGAA